MPLPSSTPVRRGVVAVIVRQGRFLVIRRSQTVVAPLAYCFPGGGIEAGEFEAAALVREIQEELGVEVQPVQRLWESLTPWNVHLAWWACLSPPAAAFTANPAEIESIHWHTPDEIRLLPGLLESNLAFLDALARQEFVLDETVD